MEKILNKYKIIVFLVTLNHVWAQDTGTSEFPTKVLPTETSSTLQKSRNPGVGQQNPLFAGFGVALGRLLIPALISALSGTKGYDLTESEIVKFKLWPNGLIPYYIDTVSFEDKDIRARIHKFLDEVNGVTRLRFVELLRPPTDEKTRWVMFLNRRGQQDCGNHSIKKFTNEGVQSVVLGYDCMSTGGDLAEAVLAIAGVPPQHNAPNRDEYIKIKDENILPDKKIFFEKLGDKDWLFHNVPYDYQSAGHFHSHRYSRNGKPTIEGKSNDLTIGDNTKLSYYDLLKLNMLYNFITHDSYYNKPKCEKVFKKNLKYNKYDNRSKLPVPYALFVDPLDKPSQYTGVNITVYNTDIKKVIADPKKDNTEEKAVNTDNKKGTNDQESVYDDETDDDKLKPPTSVGGIQKLSAPITLLSNVNQRILLNDKKRNKKDKNLVVDKMSVDLTALNDNDSDKK